MLSVNYNAKDLLPQVCRGGNFPELANETVLLHFATRSTFTWQCFHVFIFMILNVFWEKNVKVVCGISSFSLLPEFLSLENQSVLYKLTVFVVLCSTTLNIYFEYYSVRSKLSAIVTYPS